MGNLSDRLAHLLSICNDGKEGYKAAGANINDEKLKTLFLKYAEQRAVFAEELRGLISDIEGGWGNQTGGPLGFIHRAWMGIVGAISGKNRINILNACLVGEQAALRAYDEILANESMSRKVEAVLSKHREEIAGAIQNLQSLKQKVA